MLGLKLIHVNKGAPDILISNGLSPSTWTAMTHQSKDYERLGNNADYNALCKN